MQHEVVAIANEIKGKNADPASEKHEMLSKPERQLNKGLQTMQKEMKLLADMQKKINESLQAKIEV